jgi:hypothetical protein
LYENEGTFGRDLAMTQAELTRIAVRFWPWAAGGLVAALLQGLVVFAWWGNGRSFLSFTGLGCILVPLGVEVVVAIIAIKNLDELHAQTVTNPHSLFGTGLPKDATPPAPPLTRKAWDGGFEPPDSASDSMSKRDH